MRFLLLPAVRRQVEPREGIEPTQSATVRRRARTAQDPDRARPWNRRFLRHAGNMLGEARETSAGTSMVDASAPPELAAAGVLGGASCGVDGGAGWAGASRRAPAVEGRTLRWSRPWGPSEMASAGSARTGIAEVDSAIPLSGGSDSLLGNQEYRCPLSPGN